MLCAWLLAISLTQAQVPQLISYQAVARDLTGKVLSEKPISVQVEILQGSNQGTAVYAETHELTTTKTGTINLLIGGGNALTGTFAEIDWSQAPYFLRLGLKQEKETEYTEVSNTQMVSVPYALYAEKAGSAINESESGLKKDFILTVAHEDNYFLPLFTILNGGTIYKPAHYNDYYDRYEGEEVGLMFAIVYLNGRDQQLTAEIEGDEVVLNPSRSTESTRYGRCYSFTFWKICYPEKQSYTLLIKDKEGKVLERYPFFIQHNLPDYNYTTPN